LEQELTRIWFTLSGLPTARSVLAGLLEKYGYAPSDEITTTSLEYSRGGGLKWFMGMNNKREGVSMNTPLEEAKNPKETASFDELMIVRAADFKQIKFSPAPNSPHAKQHGTDPVTLKPEDVQDELKKQLDLIKSALKGRACQILAPQLKQALGAEHARLTQIYKPMAFLDRGPLPTHLQILGAIKRGLGEKAYANVFTLGAKIYSDSQEKAWLTPRKVQHNALIFKLEHDSRHSLCTVKFDLKTGAFQSIKLLPLAGNSTQEQITQYVREHPIEFFHQIPKAEPGAGVQYMVPEMEIEAPVPRLIEASDVHAVLALKHWLSVPKFEQREKIPNDVRTMSELLSKLGLNRLDEAKPELKQAADTLNGLHRRFAEAKLFQIHTGPHWAPILAMSWDQRQQALQAVKMLETVLNQRFAEEQAPYFEVLDKHTGLYERIDRLVRDADRYFDKPSLGEFFLSFVPFVDCVRDLIKIQQGDPIDTEALLNGGEPKKEEGVSYGSALMTSFGCAMDVVGLIPFLKAGAAAAKALSLVLTVAIKQAALAGGQAGLKQLVKQAVVNPAMKAAVRSLGRAGVQLVVQGVDQVSPIPGTDSAINKMLKTMARGTRGSAKAVRGLLQMLDPALFKKLGDMPPLKPVSIVSDTMNLNTHFKVGKQGEWQIDWNNPPPMEVRSGRQYVKDSEVAVAIVGGEDVAVKQVGTNALGQNYFKRIDLETGELDGGTLRILPENELPIQLAPLDRHVSVKRERIVPLGLPDRKRGKKMLRGRKRVYVLEDGKKSEASSPGLGKRPASVLGAVDQGGTPPKLRRATLDEHADFNNACRSSGLIAACEVIDDDVERLRHDTLLENPEGPFNVEAVDDLTRRALKDTRDLDDSMLPNVVANSFGRQVSITRLDAEGAFISRGVTVDVDFYGKPLPGDESLHLTARNTVDGGVEYSVTPTAAESDLDEVNYVSYSREDKGMWRAAFWAKNKRPGSEDEINALITGGKIKVNEHIKALVPLSSNRKMYGPEVFDEAGNLMHNYDNPIGDFVRKAMIYEPENSGGSTIVKILITDMDCPIRTTLKRADGIVLHNVRYDGLLGGGRAIHPS